MASIYKIRNKWSSFGCSFLFYFDRSVFKCMENATGAFFFITNEGTKSLFFSNIILIKLKFGFLFFFLLSHSFFIRNSIKLFYENEHVFPSLFFYLCVSLSLSVFGVFSTLNHFRIVLQVFFCVIHSIFVTFSVGVSFVCR